MIGQKKIQVTLNRNMVMIIFIWQWNKITHLQSHGSKPIKPWYVVAIEQTKK
jgi:hypothetical protein